MTADPRRGSGNYTQLRTAQCGDCWNLWPREAVAPLVITPEKYESPSMTCHPSRTGENGLLSFKSVNRGGIPYALPHFSNRTELLAIPSLSSGM